jgi:hypothetical protein
MAKSMRVNRNKKYSKRRRTNNRATSRKSARREKKRNSRRNNRRNLRGGGGDNGGAKVAAAAALEREEAKEPAGSAPAAPAPGTSPPANNAPTQVEGFSNPLYDAVKVQEQKVTLKTQLTLQIADVMKLLSKRYLEEGEGEGEKPEITYIKQQIREVEGSLEEIATKQSLVGDYQNSNLLGLTIELVNLTRFLDSPPTDESQVTNVKEYINKLFFYFNAYDIETKGELDDFLKIVQNSKHDFTRDEYEDYSRRLTRETINRLPAADLLYGIKAEASKATATNPDPEPEQTPKSSDPKTPPKLTGGTLVRVVEEKINGKIVTYRAQIESESK